MFQYVDLFRLINFKIYLALLGCTDYAGGSPSQIGDCGRVFGPFMCGSSNLLFQYDYYNLTQQCLAFQASL
jgi:hypothetical protein